MGRFRTFTTLIARGCLGHLVATLIFFAEYRSNHLTAATFCGIIKMEYYAQNFNFLPIFIQIC